MDNLKPEDLSLKDLEVVLEKVKESNIYFNYYVAVGKRDEAILELCTLCGSFYVRYHSLIYDHNIDLDTIRTIGVKSYVELLSNLKGDIREIKQFGKSTNNPLKNYDWSLVKYAKSVRHMVSA